MIRRGPTRIVLKLEDLEEFENYKRELVQQRKDKKEAVNTWLNESGEAGPSSTAANGASEAEAAAPQLLQNSWMQKQDRKGFEKELATIRDQYQQLQTELGNSPEANQEKTLETSLENITSRVQDLKTALTAFLAKLEHEHQTLNWPSVLDNFALLSGQINMLNKVLRHEKTPSLKEYVLLPLNLKQERDEELEKMTEGRVPTFNHEVVPNYLRTKLVPETEEREIQLIKESSHLTPEVAQRQINTLNKLSNHILDIVNKEREEREADVTGMRPPLNPTQPAETNYLINSVITGRGLRMLPARQPGPYMQGGPGLGPAPGAIPQQPPRPQDQHGPMGKVPSSINTNIKAGSAMHPNGHRPGMQ